MSDQNTPPHGGHPGGPSGPQHNPYHEPTQQIPQHGGGQYGGPQGPYGGPQQGPGPQTRPMPTGPYGGPPQQQGQPGQWSGASGYGPQQGQQGQGQQQGQYGYQGQQGQYGPGQGQYGPGQGQPPYGQGPYGGPQQFQPETKKRRGKLIPLIAALAVLIVFGAGGAFAYSRLSGGGDQPAAVLPGTAVAYGRVDLDPSAGQKVNAIRFMMKFPSVKNGLNLNGDNDDLKQKLFELLKKEAGDDLADVDYDADIKPWLGDRAGIAAVPLEDKPEPVIAVQIKDEQKARAGLDKLFADEDDKPGQVYYKGYVVIAEDQGKAEAAVTAAKSSPLSSNDKFSKDMDDLGDQGVASFWMDTKGLAQLAGNKLTDEQRKSLPEGSMAAVVRFDPSYVELKGVVHGDKSIKSGAAKADEVVTKLPGTTAAAIGFSDGESYVDKMWESIQKSGSSSGVDINEMARKFGEQYGLKIPDDLKTLLGKNFVLAVDKGQTDGVPSIGAKAKTDPAKAEEVVDKLANIARNQGNTDVQIAKAKDGDTLAVATNQGYADTLLKGGDLGDSDSFKKAIPDAGDAVMLGYVDFPAVKELARSSMRDNEDYDALRSAGIASRITGDGEAEFTVRVVTK